MNRRNFLKLTGLSALAALVPAVPFVKKQPKEFKHEIYSITLNPGTYHVYTRFTHVGGQVVAMVLDKNENTYLSTANNAFIHIDKKTEIGIDIIYSSDCKQIEYTYPVIEKVTRRQAGLV